MTKYIELLEHAELNMSRRFYENDVSYKSRILMTNEALQLDYDSPQWFSIANWTDICPLGNANRLPPQRISLTEHQCYYLEIKNIRPENWIIPFSLSPWKAPELPRRATYKPQKGDIFLSRFREPLGKAVLYNGELTPLYVSSNYLLLRPKAKISPLLILALLKSPFITCQIYRLARRMSTIAEMHIRDAPDIKLPDLPAKEHEKIIHYAEKRLHAEEEYQEYQIAAGNSLKKIDRIFELYAIMSNVETTIDETIWQFIAQTQD